MSAIDNGAAGLQASIDLLSRVEIPVLRESVRAFTHFAEDEERVTARDVSSVILRDPLLTLNVLRHLQAHRCAGATEITTITHAALMLGIPPVLREFRGKPVIEDVLADRPEAMQGLMSVVNRARHAALHAREWAALRHDVEPDEIITAALLHDVAEMLLWCVAPQLMARIVGAMCADRTQRSAALQESILGFRVSDLQLALVEKWGLPRLLRSLMDDQHSESPRADIVRLAVALASHAANGWDDPRLPHDYAEIQRHLAISRYETMQRIFGVAVAAAGFEWRAPYALAAWLPPVPAVLMGADDCTDSNAQASVARSRVTERLQGSTARRAALPELLAVTFHGMRVGMGLGRGVFLEIEADCGGAMARYVAGPAAGVLRTLRVNLETAGVFSRVLREGEPAWHRLSCIRDSQAPQEAPDVVASHDFFAAPIRKGERTLGLIYCDGMPGYPELSDTAFEYFRALCELLSEVLDSGREL